MSQNNLIRRIKEAWGMRKSKRARALEAIGLNSDDQVATRAELSDALKSYSYQITNHEIVWHPVRGQEWATKKYVDEKIESLILSRTKNGKNSNSRKRTK